MCKMKEFAAELTEMTTMTKKEYFLTIATCFLGGMVLGMFCSPRKFTKIGCENGSNNSNNRPVVTGNGAQKVLKKRAQAQPQMKK